MATLRSRDPDEGSIVRAALVARLRWLADTFGPTMREFPAYEPWTAKADALERGERITVSGFEVARFVPGIGPHGYWIVEPDGSLTPNTLAQNEGLTR